MNYMDKYNEWRNNPYFDKETKEELLNLEGNEKERVLTKIQKYSY